jgi:hypothetical protein
MEVVAQADKVVQMVLMVLAGVAVQMVQAELMVVAV